MTKKTDDRAALRRKIIGEAHADAYEKRFREMDRKGSPLQLHLPGLLAGYFWAFYRGLYGWGVLSMALFFAGVYLLLRGGEDAGIAVVILGNALTVIPGLFFGFYGTRLYRTALERIIDAGLALPPEKRQKWFDEYADGNTRLVLGLLFASAFIFTAFFLSTQT